MTLPAGIVDATELPVYDLGIDHPFARDRQRPLFDLLAASGMLAPDDRLPWRPATDDELATVHDRDYIAVLQAVSVDSPAPAALLRAFARGLGTSDNPIAPGQHRAAAAAVGATIACVDAVLEGRRRAAFNPAGGLHHAMPDGAAGFCLYNDVAIGIRRARGRGCARVLYVDFDVHHGDGVERTFVDDPTVLTLSFHETPAVRYPGTGWVTDRGRGAGLGYALNVPLEPGTDDASWIDCVERVLPTVARAFRPDLIVSQHGCDTHRDDPLATLECTVASMARAAGIVHGLAAEVCGGRWVATGGGGYQPYAVIPRAWALVWATLAARPVPGRLDPDWCARWRPRAGGPLPADWSDPPRPLPRAAAVAASNRRTVDELLAGLSWLRP